QRHLAAEGLLLLGQEDDPKAALADRLQQLVRADHRARALDKWCFIDGDDRPIGPTAMNAAQRLMRVQEALDPCPPVSVAAAGLVQERGPLVGRALQGSEKKRPGLVFDGGHGVLPGSSPLSLSATQPGAFSHDGRKNPQTATCLATVHCATTRVRKTSAD